MAKKDFKSNPTLAFISAGEADAKEGKASTPTGEEKLPAEYKRASSTAEAKSKRVQLLVQPSLYEAVKAKATAEGISFNEAVNVALKKYIKKR